jgi:hypothetical protein
LGERYAEWELILAVGTVCLDTLHDDDEGTMKSSVGASIDDEVERDLRVVGVCCGEEDERIEGGWKERLGGWW